MNDPHDVQLGPQLIELPKSKLPAGLADESGAYPFFCSSPDPKAIGQWLVDGEAVVLGTGGVASVNFGRGKFAYSTDCWAIQARRGELSTEYLYRVLQQQLHRIDYAGFEGSGLRHLRKDFIRNLTVDVPGEDVQARVSEILAAVDDAIAQTEMLIAKTQQIKAGLMHDLFTRGVMPDGQLRPPRDQAPERYKESALGWIPSEWEVSNLNELVNPARPIAYGILMPGYGHPGGVPVVKVKDIRNRSIAIDGLLLTSPQIDNEYRRSRLRAGDVLFTIRGTVGRVARVPRELEGANITQDTARIDLGETFGHFASYYFETSFARRFFDINTLGVAVQGINLGELRKLPVPIPPATEQERIIEKLSSMASRIESEVDHLWKLRAQRLGLMSDLLSD